MGSLSMILSVLCLLLSVTGSRATDEELRLEIEEAASDSRLLADELADMLARLEADNSRQEAVEAAVLGDDLKVESALQEMLDKIEKLETVANEDLETPELRGTLEEKIEKEEELRQTLETLETVAKQIEDVSSVKDLKTIDDMTELLQKINDKIEDSVDAETGKTKSGVKTALHLNGIVDMIKSLEKVTTDLKSMQDNIDDYFDEDDNSTDKTNEKLIKSGEEGSKASKLLSSFFKSKSSENSSVEKKNRKGKQLDDDLDYADEEYEDFGGDAGDAAAESDAKSGADIAEESRSSGGGDSSKSSYDSHDDDEEEEVCEDTEAKSRVRVCTPKFSRAEETINLYSSIPEDVRHCYDVSKTVCTESSQIVSKEVCIYGYTQNVVVAPVQSAEITFERKFKPFSVSKCSKTVVKDGYKDKKVEECVQEVKEIPYRLPSIVDNLDDFLELNIPEPEAQCQLYRYDVPEVMCRDSARRECSDMAFLSPVTTSHYIQTSKPSYEGKCSPQTLRLDQQKCKPPPKKTKTYSTYYRL